MAFFNFVNGVNGVNIGYVERDIQIDIVVTNDNPPVINALNDICVTAGTLISQSVPTDPDAANSDHFIGNG